MCATCSERDRLRPTREVLARLSRLADRLGAVLGGTPDFEFAVDGGHVRAVHVRRSDVTTDADHFHTAA